MSTLQVAAAAKQGGYRKLELAVNNAWVIPLVAEPSAIQVRGKDRRQLNKWQCG
jgi:hypothetical protein